MNERGDQGDAHKRSRAKQRQPGMVRTLFMMGLPHFSFGNAGTKIAKIGITSSDIVLSQMMAERP